MAGKNRGGKLPEAICAVTKGLSVVQASQFMRGLADVIYADVNDGNCEYVEELNSTWLKAAKKRAKGGK